MENLKDFFLFSKKNSTKKRYDIIWVQYNSSQLKKEMKTKKKGLNNEWVIFALNIIVSNEFLLIIFHYMMFIND
jgi:hypothetical protein